ncbi:hypothetical protein GBAR_LOCUS22350 [Geodia barretti]|uniref:Uncharacterized protein n=1 Tax=Geodia barretti TaxID=519541 RepID=A0AA35X6M3_GEOBA|nr:hypothetical protein GBAR_LOCUS22350 [Geodia barretti]
MGSCCSKASPAPKEQTDQDVPTSHGTEAQQMPASSPEALQELRESLKHKFESEDTDGGTPIVFELPNGEKLTYNSDMSCSTKDLLCEEETELNGRDDILWTPLENGTQTKKILVSTEGPLQETYNAAESNNRWVFGGTPCTSADIFHIESDRNGTAIKAKDSGRYLSLNINGEGVPDAVPTFTSSAPSGSSTASIKGSSVTLTKFERRDENGRTAFGFTISSGDPVKNFKYYFVPGPNQIEEQGVEMDQDVPTSHGTEAQQMPASSPEALQQLRESLKPKFESVDTDGGTPIVFELPNGEKLTYNSDMSCSTKMLYEYVFYAGLVNQRFRIFSVPARRPIPCNHSKVSEINLSNLTFVVECEEGDFMEMMTSVEEIQAGDCYIQVDTPGSDGTLSYTYESGSYWRYQSRSSRDGYFTVLTPTHYQVQIKLGNKYLTVKEKNNTVDTPKFCESKTSSGNTIYHQVFYSCGSQTSFSLSLETQEPKTYYFTPKSGKIEIEDTRKNLAIFSQNFS